MASITQRFLVPVSTVSARNAWHNDPPFLIQKRQKCLGGYFQKNWEGMCGTLPETLTLFQTKICDFSYRGAHHLMGSCPTLFQTWSKIWYPISELINWSPGARRVTSCCGTYTVVGVNIEGEMVLSPNDEEVANSSKNIPNSRLECTNHTLLQTKTAEKTYHLAPHLPIRITYIRDSPPGRKTGCRLLVSLLTQARLI